MVKAISNTSPLLYLYRIGGMEWLSKLFDEVWTPEAVKNRQHVLAWYPARYALDRLRLRLP